MRAPAAVVAALAALALAAPADAGNQPRILEFEYSEDYEMIGRHHNMYATLKGDAERVVARWDGVRSEGKFDDVAGPQSYWNFRDRDFVRGLLDDLHADGERGGEGEGRRGDPHGAQGVLADAGAGRGFRRLRHRPLPEGVGAAQPSFGVCQGVSRRSDSRSLSSSAATRVCSSVSRSRRVTVPSSVVWPSTVTPQGVPISSWRR